MPVTRFVWLTNPLPEKVRNPVIAGPVSVDAATAVMPSAFTGSDELLVSCSQWAAAFWVAIQLFQR